MNKEHEPTTPTAVPCGHEDDCVRLYASGLAVAFCTRCERGFDLGPVATSPNVKVLSVRDALQVLAFP